MKPSKKDKRLEQPAEDSDKKVLTSEEQIDQYLKHKDHKDKHLNFINIPRYFVSTGSLMLDMALEGGVSQGVHRFRGEKEGGKTSCALAIARNFQLTVPNSKVIYIAAEQRLWDEIIKRMGIDTSPEKWFKFDCNIADEVFDFMRTLIRDNPTKRKYMFIIDSTDALMREKDIDKPFTDSESVAGGALINSVFLKKMTNTMTKYGHMTVLISQLREEIPVGYSTGPKPPKASGGRAIDFYSSWVFDFRKRYQDDFIYENPAAEKREERGHRLGHFCKVLLDKTINEMTGEEIAYPIRYRSKPGYSVWLEHEVAGLLVTYEFAKFYNKSWLEFVPSVVEEMTKAGLEAPPKVNGERQLVKYLTDNQNVLKFFHDKLKSLLAAKQETA